MHIGLIAMSGIRACDPELLRLGLTLPGFVERSKTIASLPSLGLLTLAGMTPRSHTIAYREVADIQNVETLEPFDLVAISTFSAQVQEAYDLAERYRSMGTSVVIGGLHVTAEPEEAKQHCDAVIVGEGEPVWERVLTDATACKLQPFYRTPREGAGFDLARAPMPAYELLDMDKYNRLTVQTSRGCPFHCSFCASSILLTSRYKQKPATRVLAEIDRIRELWQHPFIEFADDNTFVNKAYWKALLPEIATRKIRWFTETDISAGDDEELLSLMANAGCVEILIGLESPVETGLNGLELRSDWKHKWFPRYRDAIRRIQSHGIRVNGCFIVGLDGHTPKVFDAIYDFVEQTELFDVQITFPTPFPGTAMYRQLKAQNRLLFDRDWRRMTLFDVTFRPDPMSVEELTQGFRELGVRLYGEEFTNFRRDTFKAKYLRGRRSTIGSAS
jgi:radical SAM superfamily enzyme YgiQ (UPF0313 family)